MIKQMTNKQSNEQCRKNKMEFLTVYLGGMYLTRRNFFYFKSSGIFYIFSEASKN